MSEESDDNATPTPAVLEDASRNQSLPEMRLESSTLPSEDPDTSLFDEEAYRVQVRQMPAALSEKDLDDKLQQEALNEGIELPQSMDEVEAVTSSLSETTILSDTNTNMQGSIMSQSTAPTSCASSERRPTTSNSIHSARVSLNTPSRPNQTDTQKKRNSVFRSRVRRIVGKKKKNSTNSREETSSAEASDDREMQSPTDSPLQLEVDLPKSSISVRSLKSAWSNQVVQPKTSYENNLDPSALKRAMECKELQDLQRAQRAERDRFLEFRKRLVDQLNHERNDIKGRRSIAHDTVLAEKRREVRELGPPSKPGRMLTASQNEHAIEELEEIQLQEEMKMAEDHRFWERMMTGRLRHIERRVHHPTPPPTPGGDTAGADSNTEVKDEPAIILPVRAAAGPNEFNHLAEQYREQKTLMHSNGGKINVLRGQQQRKMESFINQKEDEVRALEKTHNTELSLIDEEFNTKEKVLDDIFASKRALLELYWYKQMVLEQQRQERSTGLKFQLLPAMTVG